jgi:hypothetical protein
MLTVVLSPTSFFPNIRSSTPSDITIRPKVGGAGDADAPGFILENTNESSPRDVEVVWRYMDVL